MKITLGAVFCAAILGMAVPAVADSTVSCESADNLALAVGGDDCFALLSFSREAMKDGGTLVVFLHGDVSSGGPADSFKKIAPDFIQPGRMAVVLIRQGYTDSDGRQSTGSNNNRTDNATANNVDNIGAALERLKSAHKTARLVVVGHSRGSNVAGVLLGRKPGLIDAAVLFSCPCDLKTRQAARDIRRGKPGFYKSLSPLDFVEKFPSGTWVATITGANDDNTDHAFLKDWHAALEKQGVPVRDVILAGERHNWSTRWFRNADVEAVMRGAIGN